jgi:Ig-like domain CHU_C associated
MNRRFAWAYAVLAVLSAVPALAVTYVVTPDREMVSLSNAIVVASSLGSYVQRTPAGGIETVTTFSVEEVIKGSSGLQLEVHEPGGALVDAATVIPGVPRFEEGQRVLLFLLQTPQKTWAVTDLALGKFTFQTDTAGRRLLVRDDGEIHGWDPDGTTHSEPQRSADRFLTFVRAAAKGQPGNEDYFVHRMRLVATSVEALSQRKIVPNSFTITSYMLDVQFGNGTGAGGRWTTFPGAVTWFNENTESGAAGGGVTAIQAGLNAWTSDGGSNVNYSYGGSDAGHTSGLHGPDGKNTIQFDQDLTFAGAAAFTCSASSYSGVLGIGGITNATSVTNTFNSETFWTTTEGDVMMNQGIANCTLLLTTHAGDWNSALTHEIGHTLGFRHADQNRAGTASCFSDPSLECSGSAIMTANVTSGLNASLAAYDVHAVDAVYGACTPPGISQQPQANPTTIASGSQSQLSVIATGTGPTYQWYIGSPGTTSSPVGGGTGSTVMVSPTSTTSYWVRITGSCGAIDSAGVTVTVTVCTPPSVSTPAQASPTTITVGNSSTLSVGGSGSPALTYQWYVGNPPSTVSPVPSGNLASIMVSPSGTTNYWAQISNGCGTANSLAVTVTVTCVAPQVTIQPQATPSTINQGNSTQLSVTATGTSLTYQWYVGNTGSTGNPVAGGTLSTINVAPSSTTTYWVRVTNGCGTADGNSVTVTVNPATCVAPSITLDPQDQTVTAGQVNLLVGYHGTTGFVNWYTGVAPDTSHLVGSGQNLQILVTATTKFWAQVSNGCGTANSQSCTITVTNSCVSPGVSSATPNPSTIGSGDTSALTVVATGTSLSFQWYTGTASNTGNPIAGGTTASINVTPSATTSYWVRVSNGCGTADSSTVVVTVNTSCTAPAVTTQPLSTTTITAGQRVTLSVIANGSSLTYQWYQGAVDDTSTPIGTNDSNVTVQPLVNTSYWVKITNSCGSSKSHAATIIANPSKRRASRH